MKILVVDDSSTMRGIERRILEGLGAVEFAEAADGLEAMAQLARGEEFGLVLIDWNMPKMDGLTLVRRIRETDRELPLVLVTTEAERGPASGLARAGVTGCVLKPFTPDALLQKVREALSGAKAAA